MVFLVAPMTPALLSLMAPALVPLEVPCELYCKPTNESFAAKMRDAVVDGTPCYHGRASRDLCINGICKVCPTGGSPPLALPTAASSEALPRPTIGSPALPVPLFNAPPARSAVLIPSWPP